MAANEITPPFEFFTDVDGESLESGFIYIGAENFDPQTSPIQVYWDRNLTIPTAQPLRTIAGHVVNAGSAAQFFVDADAYSIRVQNKNGALVQNLLSSRQTIPFGNITGLDSSTIQTESMAALIAASLDIDNVYVASYYGGWGNTVTGPSGGHYRHKTGATNTAPTVAPPVPVSTIGTGAQAGYCWDASGAEWKIDEDELRYVEKFGAIGNDLNTSENEAAFDDATEMGDRVYIGVGNFRFPAGYSYEPNQGGLVGQGPHLTGLRFDTAHGITIPSDAGFDRAACLLDGFAVNSLSNSCDDRFAFYIPGVASGAAAVYNSGITIQNIEIGGNGRMGGGFYIKDTFRLNVQNIGFSDVSWMIRIVGSVVQSKFRNVTSNNDSAASAINRYGISTEGATYFLDPSTGLLGPENIRFIDCAYIRGERGINHAFGLDIEFVNFDTEADDFGANINAACTIRGGVLGVGLNAVAWAGISRGVSIADADDGTIIDGVDINCLRSPATPASSYAIDAGDGASPVRGLVVKNCRIRGVAGALQQAFRGRICNDVTFSENFIRTSTILGDDVTCTGEHMHFFNNINTGGSWSISDAGATTAYGVVDKNDIGSLSRTFTTRSNWQCKINGAIVSYVRSAIGGISDGDNIAHGLSSAPSSFLVGGREASEIITVTASDATNLTIAVKNDSGGSGTTQVIDYEAFF